MVSKVPIFSELEHYPGAALVGPSPMYAKGNNIWIGYRFFSEDAYAWARIASQKANRVFSFFFAETKYQILRSLPENVVVKSVTELDSEYLNNSHNEQIRILLRGMDLPQNDVVDASLEAIVRGQETIPPVPVSDADINESLSVIKTECITKDVLRYQLAAAVVINAWIEQERKAGFVQRKAFYAFKQMIPLYVQWIRRESPDGVDVWSDALPGEKGPILYIRIDGVDFSFHAIPNVIELTNGFPELNWSGVRLKPIAPIVLRWARKIFETNKTPNNKIQRTQKTALLI
jgi:hypothetical protein